VRDRGASTDEGLVSTSTGTGGNEPGTEHSGDEDGDEDRRRNSTGRSHRRLGKTGDDVSSVPLNIEFAVEEVEPFEPFSRPIGGVSGESATEGRSRAPVRPARPGAGFSCETHG
jgi:hypothetical protein